MVGISEYAEGILRVPRVVDRLHDDINHLTTLEYTTIHREIEAHPKQAVDKANLDEEKEDLLCSGLPRHLVHQALNVLSIVPSEGVSG